MIHLKSAYCALALTSCIFLWPFQFRWLGFDGIGLNFLLVLPCCGWLSGLSKRTALRLLLIAAFLLSHLTITSLVRGEISTKSLLLSAALLVYLTGLCIAVETAARNDYRHLKLMVLWLIALQLALQLVEVSGMFELERAWGWKRPHSFLPFDIPTGFFLEASHVALSVAPLAVLFLSKDRVSRLVGVLATVVLSLSVVTSTVAIFLLLGFVLTIAWSEARRRIGALSILGIGAGLLYLSFETESLSGINDRVSSLVNILWFSSTAIENLSSMVYANGLSMAAQGLVDVVGSGIGRLDRYYAAAPYSFLIEAVVGGSDPLNAQDGSSTVLKFIGEFGVFSFVAFALYGRFLWMALRRRGEEWLGVVSLFLLPTIVRGGGYFDGPLLISIAGACCYLGSGTRHRRLPVTGPIELPEAQR